MAWHRPGDKPYYLNQWWLVYWRLYASPGLNELSVNDPVNYINPGYGLSLVDTLWNASSYRQPLEQKGNPMT